MSSSTAPHIPAREKVLEGLLKRAVCPDCNGSGEITRHVFTGEYKPEICGWCTMRQEVMPEQKNVETL